MYYRSHNFFYGTWSAWQGIGGSVLSISTVLDADKRLDVFAVSTSLEVSTTSLSPVFGTWSTWSNVGQGEWLSVDAAVDPQGNLFVYALAADGTVNYQEESQINNDYWVALAEKAYVVANAEGIVDSNHPGVNDYNALNYGDPTRARGSRPGRALRGPSFVEGARRSPGAESARATKVARPAPRACR